MPQIENAVAAAASPRGSVRGEIAGKAAVSVEAAGWFIRGYRARAAMIKEWLVKCSQQSVVWERGIGEE
jgi:hypothetical protein